VSNLLAKELKRSKYRLLGLVGQGQFGRVYCASHRKTGHLFALKELNRDRFPTHKFLRELRFLLSLQHPNIVTCHALEHTSTGRYLVMDYCEGGTLRNLIENDTRLRPVYALKLVADILAGLAHAHSRGIVHCDIKPENILLTLQPQGWIARISDFGIARLYQEIGTGEGNATGSPAYMAPERFYGQYSYASDLYAVGIILYELLVGHRPFSGVPNELMSAHLNRPVKIPDQVPAPLRSILLTALQKLQARRFRSATEMLNAVQTVRASLQSELNANWTGVSLLQAAEPLPVCPYHSLQQEQFQAAIAQLFSVVATQPLTQTEFARQTQARSSANPVNLPQAQLYRVSDDRISWQSYNPDTLALTPTSLLHSVRLPAPVRSIALCSQGGIAQTDRSLYLLSRDLVYPQAVSSGSASVPALVAEFSYDFTWAIAASGEWLVTAEAQPDRIQQTVSLWNLRSASLSTCSLGAIDHAFQLLPLDARHLAVACHQANAQDSSEFTGVTLRLFTRRGRAIGAFSLPIPLRSVRLGLAPYQLLALESGDRPSVLLITLKPLRIQRLSVEIAPVLFATASWGYVLMAADGQIALLDQYGQEIGRIAGPAGPTAIASLPPCGLLIATWNGQQGCLHTIDLRLLDLDLVF
jgi:serine/threonine-protein kinase